MRLSKNRIWGESPPSGRARQETGFSRGRRVSLRQGLGQRLKGVALADVVYQSEPRTRPLYIHFPFRAQGGAEVLALRPELRQTE